MKKTPLRKVSKKRAEELKEYKKLREELLTPSVTCEVCLTRKATQIHHKKRRGKYMLDQSTYLPCCAECHRKIEDNPKWARDCGYSLDKFT